MALIKNIFATREGWSVVPLRVVIGFIFFTAGAGKLFGWFGGAGLSATINYFEQVGFPYHKLCAYLASYSEFIAGIGLLIGFFTRVCGVFLAVIMAVALVSVHTNGGWEYPLVRFCSCFALVYIGGGNWSFDKQFSK